MRNMRHLLKNMECLILALIMVLIPSITLRIRNILGSIFTGNNSLIVGEAHV